MRRATGREGGTGEWIDGLKTHKFQLPMRSDKLQTHPVSSSLARIHHQKKANAVFCCEASGFSERNKHQTAGIPVLTLTGLIIG